MSYEIVKALKVKKNGEVWLKSDSNNVFPRRYHWWHCTSLTNLLKKEGRKALDTAIVRDYWSGNMQRTNNNYEKCLTLVDRSWCNWDYTDDCSKEEREKRNNEIDEHLYECYVKFNNRPKQKCVIKYIGHDCMRDRYAYKKRGRHITLCVNVTNAKVFISHIDAELYLKSYNRDKFEIVDLLPILAKNGT